MKTDASEKNSRWEDACLCAELLAVDPYAIGGLLLNSGAGPVREAWLQLVRDVLPPLYKIRRLPLNIGDDRLIGGLDLTRTLAQGKPVVNSGILTEVNQGLLIIPSVERLDVSRTAKIVRALDRSYVDLERDGLSSRLSARFGVIALNEAREGEEEPPVALSDRLSLTLTLDGLRMKDVVLNPSLSVKKIKNAREILEKVFLPEDMSETICHVAEALGIFSIRAPLQTLIIARILAALQDEPTVTEKHVETAVRLVLSPRATRVPAEKEQNPEPAEQNPASSEPETPDSQNENNNDGANVLPKDFEIILSAAVAAIPEDLFQILHDKTLKGRSTVSNGKAGAQQRSKQRGRPCGVRRGDVRNGQVLNLIETLRAAAPLQTLRRKMENSCVPSSQKRTLIDVRAEDFRISQFKKRKNSTTIFVVDASGSSALHRLAEVKGAIEMILSECYIRRDNVALIAFRGTTAETLLPPTRSLTRAQRCIAALPGGGGTPLATAIETAAQLATTEKQKGISPTIVLLTDGKANIDRNGRAGRKTAIPDALCASQNLRNLRIPSLFIDTSPRANKDALHMASTMGARYIPLPHADSSQVAKAVFSSQYLTKEREGSRS